MIGLLACAAAFLLGVVLFPVGTLVGLITLLGVALVVFMQTSGHPPHVCAPARTCRCSLLADAPADDCPVHGWGEDRRCGTCGRFLRRRPLPVDSAPECAE